VTTEPTSPESLIALPQHSFPLAREVIRWPSNDMINSPSDDFSNSLDKNVNENDSSDRII